MYGYKAKSSIAALKICQIFENLKLKFQISEGYLNASAPRQPTGQTGKLQFWS